MKVVVEIAAEGGTPTFDIPGFVAMADKNWPAVAKQSKVIE
ncbi:MAG: hypothetical protein ACREX9_10185 [Gammaproteobacteria bacterium]